MTKIVDWTGKGDAEPPKQIKQLMDIFAKRLPTKEQIGSYTHTGLLYKIDICTVAEGEPPAVVWDNLSETLLSHVPLGALVDKTGEKFASPRRPAAYICVAVITFSAPRTLAPFHSVYFMPIDHERLHERALQTYSR